MIFEKVLEELQEKTFLSKIGRFVKTTIQNSIKPFFLKYSIGSVHSGKESLAQKFELVH